VFFFFFQDGKWPDFIVIQTLQTIVKM